MNDKEFEDLLRAVCNAPEPPGERRLRERVRRKIERHFAAHPEISVPFLNALARRAHHNSIPPA